MPLTTQRRILPASACALGLAALGLHLAVSLGNPLGTIEDDAVHVLLARSLRHGAFALPDAFGIPITDPWPGMAAVLLPSVWLLEPHWGLLRFIELLFAASGLAAGYFLARRFLPAPAAGLVILFSAFNPTLVSYAGLLNPDIPLMALAAVMFLTLESADSRRAQGVLIAGSIFAALLKPQGALLVLCLGAGVARRHGVRRGLTFLTVSLIPLAFWMLRNKLSAGLWSGYSDNWSAQASLLAGPEEFLNHATTLLAKMFGSGIAGLSGGPIGPRATAGFLVILLMGRGVLRVLRRRESPALFAMASYCILVTALHCTWLSVQPRYALCLLPLSWIMILSGVWPEKGRPYWTWTPAGIILGGHILFQDAGLLLASLRRPSAFQARTLAWINTHTPETARFESLRYNALTLLTKRLSLPPALESRDARQWFASARANAIDYLYVESEFKPGGFLSAGTDFVAGHLSSWAREHPCVSLVYSDTEEGTALYRLEPAPRQEVQKALKSTGGGASKKTGLPLLGCDSSIR